MILAPALLGELPSELEHMKKQFGFMLYPVQDEKEIIKNGKGDYLGLNLYNRQYVKQYTQGNTEIFHNNQGSQSTSLEGIRLQGLFESSFDPTMKRNQWGREVNPKVMYTALKEIQATYNDPLIFITENGQ